MTGMIQRHDTPADTRTTVQSRLNGTVFATTSTVRGPSTWWRIGPFVFRREHAPFAAPLFSARNGMHPVVSATWGGRRWSIEWRHTR